MNELEKAKRYLIDEFEKMPHTRRDLLGNAACGRKIKNLIIAFLKAKKPQSTCVTEMKSLMIDSGVKEESFEMELIPYIDSWYKAKDLLDNGYCKDLVSI